VSRSGIMRRAVTTLLGATMVAALGSVGGVAQDAIHEKPRDVVAATVRSQGHPCDRPERLRPDEEASTPDEPAWLLECSNASYWVKYRDGLAAEIRPMP
jgi:hypothetical protein